MTTEKVDRFSIDDSRWPVVVVHFPPSSTDDVIVDMFAQMAAILDRGNCSFVYDVPRLVLPNAHQRRLLANGVSSVRARRPNRVMCSAVVTQLGSVMSGMISAVTWLVTSSEPTRVFRSMDEAIEWAGGMVKRGEAEQATGSRP